MSREESQDVGGLSPQYQVYERQKCFIAYTEQSQWSDDLLSACREVLSRPEFNLEADYARRHFYPDVPLRQKALELIANARYGIYDLSYWQEEKCEWQMPRNVFIELGMAIALNRPTLLLRHANNRELELTECLKSVSGHVLEFSGETTLKRVLEKRLPQWVNAPPDRDWWNRYCIFGGRTCEYREAHPRARQWGQKTLCCYISDGPDVDREDFRGVVEDVLGRFSDLAFDYLDTLPATEGYDFLLCTHCQKVRSTPFAIYRITPYTTAETFIAIGMSIALETQFEYKIPKILLTENLGSLPSLLSGYEVFVARSGKERKAHLRTFMPTVVQKVRETTWKPRPLPFIEAVLPAAEMLDLAVKVSGQLQFRELIEIGDEQSQQANYNQALACFQRAVELDPTSIVAYVKLGQALLRLERYDQSESAYQKAIEIHPTDFESHIGLADVYFAEFRMDEARALYERSLEINPTSSRPYVGLGKVYSYIRLYERAIETYTRLVELEPTSYQAYRGLGDVYADIQRYEEAIASYQRALELSPENPDANRLLGDVYAAMGQYEEAITLYNRTIELLPDDENAYLGRGNVYASLERFDMAIADTTAAIALQPTLAPAHVQRGQVYSELEQYQAAEADFQQAIQIEPLNVLAYYNMACVSALTGDTVRALRFLQRAIDINPMVREWAQEDSDLASVRDNSDFQALLSGRKQQRERPFLDREQELRLFRDMLNIDSRQRVLWIEAESGMGKTALLYMFREICHNLGISHIFVGLRDLLISLPDLLQRIISGLQLQDIVGPVTQGRELNQVTTSSLNEHLVGMDSLAVLLFDDLQYAPPDGEQWVVTLVEKVSSQDSGARIVVATRGGLPVFAKPQGVPSTPLGGIPASAWREYVTELGVALEPENLEFLYDQFQGRPNRMAEAIALLQRDQFGGDTPSQTDDMIERSSYDTPISPEQ